MTKCKQEWVMQVKGLCFYAIGNEKPSKGFLDSTLNCHSVAFWPPLFEKNYLLLFIRVLMYMTSHFSLDAFKIFLFVSQNFNYDVSPYGSLGLYAFYSSLTFLDM